MTQIVLDAEAFKALSSDTRLQILKALDARRLTVSELGRLLDLNKATVFEHLKQLSAAELVKKEDEGRKWVYYKLTWKGRNVLHPENVQFMLLLGTAALSVGGLVALTGSLLSWWGGAGAASELGDHGAEPETKPLAGDSDEAPAAEPENQSGDTAASSAPAQGQEQLRNDDASPPESGAEAAADDSASIWQEPSLWLLLVLGLLLAATALFAFQYLRERRQERAPIMAKIRALPAPEPDYASVA